MTPAHRNFIKFLARIAVEEYLNETRSISPRPDGVSIESAADAGQCGLPTKEKEHD
jgi:hypothetical protein